MSDFHVVSPHGRRQKGKSARGHSHSSGPSVKLPCFMRVELRDQNTSHLPTVDSNLPKHPLLGTHRDHNNTVCIFFFVDSLFSIKLQSTGRHKNKHFSNRGTKGTWCVRLFTTPYVPVSALLWRTCLIAEPHLTSSVTACLGLLSHTASKANGTGRR